MIQRASSSSLPGCEGGTGAEAVDGGTRPTQSDSYVPFNMLVTDMTEYKGGVTQCGPAQPGGGGGGGGGWIWPEPTPSGFS